MLSYCNLFFFFYATRVRIVNYIELCKMTILHTYVYENETLQSRSLMSAIMLYPSIPFDDHAVWSGHSSKVRRNVVSCNPRLNGVNVWISSSSTHLHIHSSNLHNVLHVTFDKRISSELMTHSFPELCL